MQKSSRGIVALVLCLLLAAGYFFVSRQRVRVPVARVASGVPSRAAAAPPRPESSSQKSVHQRFHRRVLSVARFQQRLRDFESRYGTDFNVSYTSDHRLSRVRGGELPEKPAPGFQGGDREVALNRANEILKDASSLLGLNPAFPLSTRDVRTDEISSQVEWVQSYRGVPIEPFGRITLQLDEHGGLRGLYSDYISDPVVVNEPSLSESAARSLVLSSVHFKPRFPDRVAQGRLVLYAPGPQTDASPVKLKYAYEYWIEGRQVILDAQSGALLSEKDRREF